jgi:hypothetical protein
MNAVSLTCCCCGKPAGRFKQHYNRDVGFGLCVVCARWLNTRETPDAMKLAYGLPGINYEDPGA